MPCTPPWIWRRSIWNWPETARELLPAKPRRAAAACKPTENTSDKRHPDGCLFLFARADFRMEASGNRGFAPPGRTALRSRQSTSPRQSRRFFHIRSSPSQMAQAALLYPYYSSFPGDCNGRRQGIQADAAGSFRVRANHRSPQAAMPSGNCLTQRQDLRKIPTLILTNCFTLSVQEIPSTTKKAPQKIPAEPFLSLFLAQRIRRNTNCSSFVSQWHTAPYFRQKYRMDWVPRPCPSFGETGKPSSSNRTAVQNGLTISSMRSG